MSERRRVPNDVVMLAARVGAARYLKLLKEKGRRPTPRSLQFLDRVWLSRTGRLLSSAMHRADAITPTPVQDEFWTAVRETLNDALAVATRSRGRPRKPVGILTQAMGPIRTPRGRPPSTIQLTEEEQKAWRRFIFMVKAGMHYQHRLQRLGGNPHVDDLVERGQLSRLMGPLLKDPSFIEDSEGESDTLAVEYATEHIAAPERDRLRRYLVRHYPRFKRQYPVIGRTKSGGNFA